MERVVVEQYDLESARELIEAISPRGRFFDREATPSRWIFRGHADATWELVPCALRESMREKLHAIAGTPEDVRRLSDTNIAQAIAEVMMLRNLELELDRSGLDVPVSKPSIGDVLERLWEDWRSADDRVLGYWPDRECRQLMSLAQHYRLPTRLLDWTHSAFVAAYFAADTDRLENGDSRGRASVWALNAEDMAAGVSMRNAPNVRTIHVPRSSNPNFHAQDGVFTLHGPDGESYPIRDRIKHQPLEVALRGYNESRSRPAGYKFLYHFTFPRSIAGELLWLLEKEGVTASRLFPGHAGAVRAVRERRLSVHPR